MVIPQTPFSKPTLPVSPVFPGEQWGKVQDPSAHGWNPEELEAARRQAHAQGSAAVMVTDDGRVVANWGDTARRFRCHSIRKSLLSALYGIYVGEGRISLQSTLADLGIDDVNPSLTAEEKQARVRDLLMARSGVYHRAAGEVPAMDAMRPKRGSHAPGTFWHYNNWDFNALGTIFRERTGLSIAEAFQKRIAGPIGMEDFRPGDSVLARAPVSQHPQYPFRLSARDLARFGLLYLRRGRWNGRTLVPERWVQESTRAHSPLSPEVTRYGVYGGYGYMWWVAVRGQHFPGVDVGPGAFSAQGYGGHYLVVLPAYGLVVVHRRDTDNIGPDSDEQRRNREFGALLAMILHSKGR